MTTQPKMIKRRQVYVDHSVQKWLMIALVTLEVVLVSGALWLLYTQLIHTVEANLFRAHAVAKPDIYPLIKLAIIGLSGLLIINLLVLWIVDRLWARHLSSILQPFSSLVAKVEALDFSPDESPTKLHNVVELAHTWRHTERQRLQALRVAINELPTNSPTLSPAEKKQVRHTLETIRQLLPTHPG